MKPSSKYALACSLTCALSLPAHADLINGGFEAGFSGWSRADQVGSDGTFALQAGTTSPVNANPVPAPPGGTSAAMTDAQGPGSHLLYQDFTQTAPVASATLNFDFFVGNRNGTFVAPGTLDFATAALNQQARADIVLAGADPFSVLPGDVLLNVFQTSPGDPAVSGYTTRSIDITALLNANLNTSLRVRFAEVDNLSFFQLGVDNVSLQIGAAQPIPEPASWALMFSGFLGLALGRRRWLRKTSILRARAYNTKSVIGIE